MMASTPEEELASVSNEEIDLLIHSFGERITLNNPDFYPEDLERVKTDRLWMRRFIAHAEFKMDAAVNMLYETCQWRKEFGVRDVDHTTVPAYMMEKGNLFIRNQDKWGKKLLIFKAKFHQKGVDNFDDIKKFIVYYFERIEREAKSDQISVIFDMKDTGWTNMDMDFIRYLITLLKQYYPFFVNYLMIFEMPWLLRSAWNIIKGWLPPKFVDRVKFIDKKSIGDYIDIDNQLVDWGGSDTYVFKFEPEVHARGRAERKKSSKVNVPNIGVVSNGGIEVVPIPEVQVRKRVAPMKPVDKSEALPVESSNSLPEKYEVDHEESVQTFTPISRSPSQTPSPTHRPISKIEQPSEGIGIDADMIPNDRSQLVKVDIVVNFEKEKNSGDINGRFNIEYIATNKENVIYKVKTTDPSKFRVRPTIGVLEGSSLGAAGAEIKVTININVMEGVSLHHLARERFQVQAMVLPAEFYNTTTSVDNSSYPQLNNIWKKIGSSSNIFIETHRMTCRVDPNVLPVNGTSEEGPSSSSSKTTISKEDTRRALDSLEQKITDSFNNSLNEKFDYIIKLIYGLFALVLTIGLLIWVNIPSSNKIARLVVEEIETSALANFAEEPEAT